VPGLPFSPTREVLVVTLAQSRRVDGIRVLVTYVWPADGGLGQHSHRNRSLKKARVLVLDDADTAAKYEWLQSGRIPQQTVP
jgi:hypothetical protein